MYERKKKEKRKILTAASFGAAIFAGIFTGIGLAACAGVITSMMVFVVPNPYIAKVLWRLAFLGSYWGMIVWVSQRLLSIITSQGIKSGW